MFRRELNSIEVDKEDPFYHMYLKRLLEVSHSRSIYHIYKYHNPA